MRAALEEAWPILSREYGLRPWDIDRLTPGEVNAYTDDIRQRADQARREALQHGRR